MNFATKMFDMNKIKKKKIQESKQKSCPKYVMTTYKFEKLRKIYKISRKLI